MDLRASAVSDQPRPIAHHLRSTRAILDAVTHAKMIEYGTCTEDCTTEKGESFQFPSVLHFQTNFSILPGALQVLTIDGGKRIPQTFEELDEDGANLLSLYVGLRKLTVTQTGLKNLKKFPRFQLLKELYLGRNRISSFKGLLHLPSLTVLDISRNRLATLRYLPVLPNLERLDMSFNWLEGKLDKILERCYNLKHLNLSYNPITDVDSLLPIVHMPYLKSLNLTGCPLVLKLQGSHVYKDLQQQSIAVIHGLDLEEWAKYKRIS